ncbi:pali-domain-containing protein [Mycena maculata]|uniref:Pali-domain-containing protein n=1 Tax=Mycena maculata TaxID=230809 RepID=A0AAD7HRV2_9AGAR|nr:pali-domain-containing protein [Mycena maculata]
MPVSVAIPGVLFCFSAAVLLTFVSVSTPTWDKIYFLDAGSGSAITFFGVFGSTGTHPSVGYRFNLASSSASSLSTPVIMNLTKTLILHPIAAGMSGLASIFGLCGMGMSYNGGTVVMVLLAALATVSCLMAFLFDMVLFGIARNNFRGQGIPSQYGNACWLTLAALVTLLLGFSTTACGVFARYKKRNNQHSRSF